MVAARPNRMCALHTSPRACAASTSDRSSKAIAAYPCIIVFGLWIVSRPSAASDVISSTFIGGVSEGGRYCSHTGGPAGQSQEQPRQGQAPLATWQHRRRQQVLVHRDVGVCVGGGLGGVLRRFWVVPNPKIGFRSLSIYKSETNFRNRFFSNNLV